MSVNSEVLNDENVNEEAIEKNLDALMEELDVDDIEMDDDKSGGLIVYSPKCTDGQNNSYFSVIRLLSDPTRSLKNPFQKRLQAYVDFPEAGFQGYVDSLDNWATSRKSICPIKQKYWYFYNFKETKPHLYEMRSKVNINENYYCLAQVIKDKQKKHLEGKIVVFKFNKTIYEKIQAVIKPTKDEIESGVKKFNPFAINGKSKNLALKLTAKGKSEDGNITYTSYDNVKFMDEFTPISVFRGTGDDVEKIELDPKKENFRELLGELYADAPSLKEFEPQKWDESLRETIQAWLDSMPPLNKPIKKDDSINEVFVDTAKDEESKELDNLTEDNFDQSSADEDSEITAFLNDE